MHGYPTDTPQSGGDAPLERLVPESAVVAQPPDTFVRVAIGSFVAAFVGVMLVIRVALTIFRLLGWSIWRQPSMSG